VGLCSLVVQVTQHSATFDFWPARRHALRVTPQGERPLSVEQYEKQTGKQAKDRQREIWKQQGLDVDDGPAKPKSYSD
jgi:sulfonate dioxygenase